MKEHAHNFRDLTGQRFWRLTAISYAGKASNRSSLWRFRCDCGVEFVAEGTAVTRGKTRSCGCIRKEKAQLNLHGRNRKGCTILAPDGVLHIFASITEAAAWLGVCIPTVSRHASTGRPYKRRNETFKIDKA